MINPDVLEEILILLPLKSILKFKTVSKQWRSILESKMFVERRMKVPKKRKILAADNCNYCNHRPSLLPESRFEGDEEIVYLHCDTTRPSMNCEGLLCIPEPDWVNVLNPSTGQLRRFPYGPSAYPRFINGVWTRNTCFPVMGFGREKVTGSYQVVRICIDPMVKRCYVLDVENGKWRKLKLPSYVLHVKRNSACTNGSIYWLYTGEGYKILALDLHKDEFHNILLPAMWVTPETHLVNLEDHLAIAKTNLGPQYMLEIWSMKTEEESWSKVYSIGLGTDLAINPRGLSWFTPVAVSKSGNLVFYDNQRRLFKYYPVTDEVCCLSSNIFVISPYLENLVPLGYESGHHSGYKITTYRCGSLIKKHPDQPGSRISNFWKVTDIVLTSTLVVVVVVVGCIWLTIFWSQLVSGSLKLM